MFSKELRESVREVLSAVLPVTGAILLLMLVFLDVTVRDVVMMLLGSLMTVVGLGLFLTGARSGMVVLGEWWGARLPQYGSAALLIAAGIVLGFAVTVAEPDVRVMAAQIEAASPGLLSRDVLILTIGAGVAISVGLGMLRLLLGWDLTLVLTLGYALVFVLALFTPAEFLPVAFDSGGVTTGPLTVPFVLALNVGLARVMGTHGGVADSFGMVALASVGPVAAVLLMGMALR
ncbi:MAG: DUF1538 domain-containing protein [Bacillota bacterium]|nr:DUF1538 domain-containing protein [Bacillota bacterium]REJ35948.1 MAG: DUF1538 domain-containing protein [Bacillota bacterium]